MTDAKSTMYDLFPFMTLTDSYAVLQKQKLMTKLPVLERALEKQP